MWTGKRKPLVGVQARYQKEMPSISYSNLTGFLVSFPKALYVPSTMRCAAALVEIADAKNGLPFQSLFQLTGWNHGLSPSQTPRQTSFATSSALTQNWSWESKPYSINAKVHKCSRHNSTVQFFTNTNIKCLQGCLVFFFSLYTHTMIKLPCRARLLKRGQGVMKGHLQDDLTLLLFLPLPCFFVSSLIPVTNTDLY